MHGDDMNCKLRVNGCDMNCKLRVHGGDMNCKLRVYGGDMNSKLRVHGGDMNCKLRVHGCDMNCKFHVHGDVNLRNRREIPWNFLIGFMFRYLNFCECECISSRITLGPIYLVSSLLAYMSALYKSLTKKKIKLE